MWKTHLSPKPEDPHRAQPISFRRPLPYLSTHPDTAPFRNHNGIPDKEMLYAMDTPYTPSAEVRKALMGFRIEDTAALGLSELHRVQLLSNCTDLNTIAWIISTIRTHTSSAE